MRKHKYLVGTLLSVIGALAVSSTASAAVTSQYYRVVAKSPKQQKKVFGPLKSFKNTVDTNYTGGFSPFGTQTVLRFTKDIKFTPGKIKKCDLGAINTMPQAQSDAICGASKVGTGSATINGGLLRGVVVAYNGRPSGGSPTLGLHTDVYLPSGAYSFSTTLTGVLNTRANTLTVSIPPTGTAITHFEDDDRQEEIRQEEGSDDVLRDGSLQEEEVGQLGDHDVQRRPVAHRDERPEVQAEEVPRSKRPYSWNPREGGLRAALSRPCPRGSLAALRLPAAA